MILDGMTLDPGVLWENEFEDEGIGQDVKMSIGGNRFITNAPINGARTIVLATRSGNPGRGKFTRAQILQLKDRQKIGAILAFVYNGVTMNVMVASKGIVVKPAFKEIEGLQDTDLYVGSITLLEV